MTICQSTFDPDLHLSRFVQCPLNLKGKMLKSDLRLLKNVQGSRTLPTRIVLHLDYMVYLNLRFPKRTHLTYVENMACIHLAYNSFKRSQSSPETGQTRNRAQNLLYGQRHLLTSSRSLCRT